MTLRRTYGVLFDHFVGANKNRVRDRNPECLCCLQIQNQFKFGRLLNRQVAWILARRQIQTLQRLYMLVLARSVSQNIGDLACRLSIQGVVNIVRN